MPPSGPQPGKISSYTGASELYRSCLPRMDTSRHTPRSAASACSSSVRPLSVTAALSCPIRVLLPPARTKPESWEWTMLDDFSLKAAAKEKNHKGHEVPQRSTRFFRCGFVSLEGVRLASNRPT